MRNWLVAILALAAFGCSPVAETAPVVLAAASLNESLNEAADAYAASGHPRPVLAFAGSSALARQIVGGAKASIFISADEDWMDHVADAGLVKAGTRANLAGNRLVLVAPLDGPDSVALKDLAKILRGRRLAIADPTAVPAGRYGKAALIKLGLWEGLALAPAENVRAALVLVERGEAPFGIVYATDAQASKKVKVVARFPENSHPPIRYQAAVLTKGDSPEAAGFHAMLLSPAGAAIFARHGFTTPEN